MHLTRMLSNIMKSAEVLAMTVKTHEQGGKGVIYQSNVCQGEAYIQSLGLRFVQGKQVVC